MLAEQRAQAGELGGLKDTLAAEVGGVGGAPWRGQGCGDGAEGGRRRVAVGGGRHVGRERGGCCKGAGADVGCNSRRPRGLRHAGALQRRSCHASVCARWAHEVLGPTRGPLQSTHPPTYSYNTRRADRTRHSYNTPAPAAAGAAAAPADSSLSSRTRRGACRLPASLRCSSVSWPRSTRWRRTWTRQRGAWTA